MKKRFSVLFLAVFLCTALTLPCFADTEGTVRLVDNAQLLSADEAASVSAALDSASAEYGADFVVLTVNSLDETAPAKYADSFYAESGYAENGALLLVDMADRVWWISTHGTCQEYIAFSDIEAISKNFVPHLSSGRYSAAFTAYLDSCTALMGSGEAVEGEYADRDLTSPALVTQKSISPLWIPCAVAIGLVIGLISVSIMKRKMKTVHSNDSAEYYLKDGSMNLTENRDVFLYSTVSKSPRANSNNSSGGSMRMGPSGHNGGGHF